MDRDDACFGVLGVFHDEDDANVKLEEILYDWDTFKAGDKSFKDLFGLDGYLVGYPTDEGGLEVETWQVH